MHCAVESGCEYMVQYILEERPDALYDTDTNSRPPQHYAAALKHSIVLEYLLSQGVDIMETYVVYLNFLYRWQAEETKAANIENFLPCQNFLLFCTTTISTNR